MIELITDHDKLEKTLLPVFQRNGQEIPTRGAYIAAVEFDNAGEVKGYQLLQTGVFFEGMYAKDHSVNLLGLYRKLSEHLDRLGVSGRLTLTRNDETGKRIGRLANRLGFEDLQLTVWRKK